MVENNNTNKIIENVRCREADNEPFVYMWYGATKSSVICFIIMSRQRDWEFSQLVRPWSVQLLLFKCFNFSVGFFEDESDNGLMSMAWEQLFLDRSIENLIVYSFDEAANNQRIPNWPGIEINTNRLSSYCVCVRARQPLNPASSFRMSNLCSNKRLPHVIQPMNHISNEIESRSSRALCAQIGVCGHCRNNVEVTLRQSAKLPAAAVVSGLHLFNSFGWWLMPCW